MARLDLDGLIACGGPNHWSYGGGVFWLSNHQEWHALSVYLFVPLEGEPTLVYGMAQAYDALTAQGVWQVNEGLHRDLVEAGLETEVQVGTITADL